MSPSMSPCVVWPGQRNANGYGVMGHRLVHRVLYEALVGPVGDGLELDHLCRVRACVNVRHLEPVTHAENVRRGAARPPIRKAGDRGSGRDKSVACPQGHVWTAATTYRARDGFRKCRPCHNASEARRARARRLVAIAEANSRAAA